MKTLILNGSPRLQGDTASLIVLLKRQLCGETTLLSAYRDNISPCVDCRCCRETGICAIRDDMDVVYADDFDTVVVASPVYFSAITPPMLAIVSRFQADFNGLRFRSETKTRRPKKGAVILVGGASGGAESAGRHAYILMKALNAHGSSEHTVTSMRTDFTPAAEDPKAIEGIREIAAFFNGPSL
ncbi:MAG: flavodoxin family protein [Clostridiales Family XIII bacterium]|jgi:multimeric flavodoxin WrbA|nr:flavodoxin family protein [Clostridiales Family XIII bacterium]